MEAVTASVLLADLRHRGIAVAVEHGELVLRARKGALTPEIKAAVAAGKRELLELVRSEADGVDADDHAGDPVAEVAAAGPGLPGGRATDDHRPGERADARVEERHQDAQGGTAHDPGRTLALDAAGEGQSELIWDETATDQILHDEITRLARLCPTDWRLTEADAPALRAAEDAINTAFQAKDIGALRRALRAYRWACFRSFRRHNAAGRPNPQEDIQEIAERLAGGPVKVVGEETVRGVRRILYAPAEIGICDEH